MSDAAHTSKALKQKSFPKL